MIKIGTLCYVVPSCLASPLTRQAVGRIVEVVSAPYEAPGPHYLPGTYYDVAFEGWTYWCRSDKLKPISDPGGPMAEQLKHFDSGSESAWIVFHDQHAKPFGASCPFVRRFLHCACHRRFL